jgi:polar amino acid transport system permease protein
VGQEQTEQVAGVVPSIRPEAETIEAVPVRHYGRWVAAVVSLLAAALVIRLFALSPNINWAAVREYLAYPTILSGLRLTIIYTLVSMAIAVGLGVVLATMRLSVNPVLRAVSWVYVWLFRGVPLLVQIILWFNIALVLPRVGIGIPGTSFWWETFTSQLVTTSVAAVLALSLCEAAFMAEIVRAGIQVVDFGQTEAGLALGMRRALVFRLIVLPQAMRAIIPPTGNEFIGLLKNTSLVSVIAAMELLTQAQIIYARTLLTVELLFVVSFWYLVATSLLSWGQYYIERYFARGSSNRPLPPTPLQHARASFTRMFGGGGRGTNEPPGHAKAGGAT